MLQFWKRSGKSHEKNASRTSTDSGKEHDGAGTCTFRNHTVEERLPPLAGIDDEGLFDIGEFELLRDKSRLSKKLQDVLYDKNALTYFLQFMESRDASPYILCWLDIDTFRSDLKACSKKRNSPIDHDSLSVSTDCDSYTADSNSLCDFSTEVICDKEPSDSSCKSKSDKKPSVQSFVDIAVSIFKKYVAQEAEVNIKCTEELRKETMENVCSNDKVLAGTCFDLVQKFVYNVMENDYFTAFLDSDFFCKYQIDVLTSGNVVLDDILYNETALFYFMEFLEVENQRSLLEFWMAATNFQQQLQRQKEFLDPVEAQNDAIVLYDKYFSLQAHCPLGFSDKVRLAVEQSICGQDGLILDCFHLPLKIVEKVLEKNYFKSFLASQLFYKYLSDLINTVQTNGYLNNIERRNSPSDCSSEKSFGQNTFLALEMPRTAKKTSDMTIDTRELYDPDTLWKRRKYHKLSIGHVNELGKYEAEYDPEPDSKEFKLKNVLKKVVSLEEEHKKKEEMAWQVAEMIIKDITNVTLNDQKI
nr:unnamed protein product [Callosobruchus chinensis]